VDRCGINIDESQRRGLDGGREMVDACRAVAMSCVVVASIADLTRSMH
jgi:hypothetical protein